MGFEFLARTYRATALLTCLASPAAALYGDTRLGLAVLLGSAWSLLNFKLIESWVRLLGPGGKSRSPLASWTLLGLKLPVLYGAGALLLRSGLPPLGLVAGFGLVFLVVTLKAAGAWASRPEWRRARALPGLLVAAGPVALLVLAVLSGTAAAAGHVAGHAPAAAAHAAAAHPPAAHAAAEQGPPELPNLVTYMRAAYEGKSTPAWLAFLHGWENVFFSFLAALLVALLLGFAGRRRALVPAGLQNFAEWLVAGIHDFAIGILGPDGRRYVPFLGSLFLYIVAMNWLGLIPGLKSPTSNLNTTVALALIVFVYVQFIGITRLGIGGYLFHFAGQPRDLIGWGTAIVLFPIEIMGELIKPISLSCRLFGNILGEDMLLAVFVGLGLLVLSFVHSPIGVPLQLPFMFLSLLMSVIQGLVFSLLSTIYILMMLPHDEHHGAHAGGEVAHH